MVVIQNYPYLNYPRVYAPQWQFQACCDSTISLLLSQSAQNKQAGVTLYSHMINEIPKKSMDIPICRYSYYMLKYCGMITCWVVQAQIHTMMHVTLDGNKEINGRYSRTKNSPMVTLMQSLADSLSERCEYVFILK